MPEAGLRVVAVDSFLDVEQQTLASGTTVTVLNADLDTAVAPCRRPRRNRPRALESPVGAGTRLRHPDGLIVEYLEHRPGDDVSSPRSEFS